MKDISALVRPYMAVSGWLCVCIVVVISWFNGMLSPQVAIGILSAPGAVYLTDRTVTKHKTPQD